MTMPEGEEALRLKMLGSARRQTLHVSQAALVKVGPLLPGNSLPLMIQPAVEGLSLIGWATRNREFIEARLVKHGGILFRDFDVKSVAEFEQFIMALAGELLEYSYRSTPRSQVSGRIYTSTEYPADQAIPLHNEQAYSLNWPMKIWFFCVQAARQGGETPIADSRKVFARIDPTIREQFQYKKLKYVRNYGDGLDLAWQNVFQTTDRTVIEDYCRRAGIEFEWKDNNRLRTSQVCQAVAAHPKTGTMVWFNQAHLSHISSLAPAVRASLLSVFKEEDLPRNVYYGDGSSIDTSTLDEIREIYRQEVVTFPWQEGDILMLDNMLTAHGRMPFVSPRQVLVGMAEPYTNMEI